MAELIRMVLRILREKGVEAKLAVMYDNGTRTIAIVIPNVGKEVINEMFSVQQR